MLQILVEGKMLCMGFHDVHNFRGVHKKFICHGNLHYSLLKLLHESYRSDSYSSFTFSYFLIGDMRALWMRELCSQILFAFYKRHILKYKLSFTRFSSILHWVLLMNALCFFIACVELFQDLAVSSFPEWIHLFWLILLEHLLFVLRIC